MTGARRIHLEVTGDDQFAEISFADPAGGDLNPPRCIISLQRAGHMGKETAERRANRAGLFRLLGLDSRRVFGVTQVHGQAVLAVDRAVAADVSAEPADGLVIGEGETVLSVTVADCLPIFLVEQRGGARGLVHSGWKGTGIVLRALALLHERYGADAGDVRAVVGPGIGECCYAVDRARYDAFTAAFGTEAGVARGGRYYLDLRRANVELLRRHGVRDITVVTNCTCCESAFGSYRRDGKEKFHNMLVLFGRF